MYLIVFIILEVSSEWVEISQQHYRKPFKSHYYPVEPTNNYKAEENMYSNHTIADYNWNDAVHRTPSKNKLNLVDFPTRNVYSSTTRATFTIETIDTSEISDEYGITEESIPFGKKDYGLIERIPNVGSVKRIQFTKSSVRSPILKHSNTATEVNSGNPLFQNKYNEDQPFLDKSESLDGNTTFQNKHKITKPLIEAGDENVDEKLWFNDLKRQSYNNNSFTMVMKPYSSESSFTTTYNRKEYTNDHSKDNEEFRNHTNTKKITIPPNNTNTTGIMESGKMPSDRNEIYSMANKGLFNKTPNPLHTRTNFAEDNNSKHVEKITKSSIGHIQNKNKLPPIDNNHNQKGNNESNFDGNVKSNTMENVMKFMKVVADTISRNTRRSVGSKMRYLEDLKNSILANIEDRIDATWPDDEDTSKTTRRRSRSTHTTARGHVEFPSSESTLMTISFLTFAVFLIKLVLQIIQTYKNKTMMVAPLVVATAGRAAIKQLRARKNNNQ